MSPNPSKPRIVLRAPLVGAAALVGFAVLVSFAGPRGNASLRQPPGPVATERWLQFADRDDGAVVVTDAADGRVLDLVTGQNGFLRCTLSGLARIRRTEGIGATAPFKLTSYADHRLTLGDPTTGQTIELEAFGPTNEAVFAQFLTMEPSEPREPI